MTANPQNEAMAAALARLWTRFLPEIESRVAILEAAAASLVAGSLTAEQRQAAHDAAHKLAGTLGTFGLPRGTDLARKTELFLEGNSEISGESPFNEWVAELGSLIRDRM